MTASRPRLRIKAVSLIGAALLLTGLAACKPDNRASTPSQVIATVNGKEISILQFNYALKRVGIPNPGEPVRREITEKLIDRELAMQQALTEQLHETPEVMLQLEEARRDVLAQAYAEKVATTAQQPSEAEVARYFAEHPELFANRRIFRLRELALPGDLPQIPEIKRRLAQKQPLQQLTAWLREEKIGFNEQLVVRAAEQLPIETLPRMNAANENDTVVFESPRGIMAYAVLSSQAVPMSWEISRPIIQDYLRKQSGKQAVDARIKQLRASTSITITPAFAPSATGNAGKP